MRFVLGVLTGVLITVWCYQSRSWRRIVWWLFTSDVRRTDPHLYGWKKKSSPA